MIRNMMSTGGHQTLPFHPKYSINLGFELLGQFQLTTSENE